MGVDILAEKLTTEHRIPPDQAGLSPMFPADAPAGVEPRRRRELWNERKLWLDYPHSA